MAEYGHYWDEYSKRAKKAKEHARYCGEYMQNEIAASILGADVFMGIPDRLPEPRYSGTRVVFKETDSVKAVMDCNGTAYGKTAVLNFASYKNPGGKFLEGSCAQEESLCHESDLYNILSSHSVRTLYYEKNSDNNRGLYTDRSLYIPKVIFWRYNEKAECDVITCAAPNKRVAQDYCHVTDAENREALISRCRHVFSVAAQKHVDTLILGAYGCGVFRQNPDDVAEIFSGLVKEYDGHFKCVIFAVPDRNGDNYKAFEKKFGTAEH